MKSQMKTTERRSSSLRLNVELMKSLALLIDEASMLLPSMATRVRANETTLWTRSEADAWTSRFSLQLTSPLVDSVCTVAFKLLLSIETNFYQSEFHVAEISRSFSSPLDLKLSFGSNNFCLFAGFFLPFEGKICAINDNNLGNLIEQKKKKEKKFTHASTRGKKVNSLPVFTIEFEQFSSRNIVSYSYSSKIVSLGFQQESLRTVDERRLSTHATCFGSQVCI